MATRHCGRACRRNHGMHRMASWIHTAVARVNASLARWLRHGWARWLLVVLALPTLMLLGFGLYGLYLLGQNTPVAYADPAEHFKYGSTRGEMESGLPYLSLIHISEPTRL